MQLGEDCLMGVVSRWKRHGNSSWYDGRGKQLLKGSCCERKGWEGDVKSPMPAMSKTLTSEV